MTIHDMFELERLRLKESSTAFLAHIDSLNNSRTSKLRLYKCERCGLLEWNGPEHPPCQIEAACCGLTELPERVIVKEAQVKTYSHARYAQLVEETIVKLHYLSAVKGGEYAGDEDRLANFRRNAERLGMSMEAVWAVYAAKHFDSIMQYIKDINAGRTRERSEPLSGRADDIIVYMLLFKAMLEESGEK